MAGGTPKLSKSLTILVLKPEFLGIHHFKNPLYFIPSSFLASNIDPGKPAAEVSQT